MQRLARPECSQQEHVTAAPGNIVLNAARQRRSLTPWRPSREQEACQRVGHSKSAVYVCAHVDACVGAHVNRGGAREGSKFFCCTRPSYACVPSSSGVRQGTSWEPPYQYCVYLASMFVTEHGRNCRPSMIGVPASLWPMYAAACMC